MTRADLIGAIEIEGNKKNVDRIYMVTDTNVEPLIPEFTERFQCLTVQAGERYKTLESAIRIWEFLCAESATRRSMLLNVGGGMVSDLGGFAASTFKRGIPYINVATTLLSAVDAAIGGKTGVDFMGLKNEIGTFAMPLKTIPLIDLIIRLPRLEWLSGCGEVLKYAVLIGEGMLEKAASPRFIVDRDPALVKEVVEVCAEFKRKIVAEDPFDKGVRRILNLGHTFGHALESLMLSKGTPLPHGIAVAYGLLYVLDLNVKTTGRGRNYKEAVEAAIKRYFPPVCLSPEDNVRIDELMKHDKKNTEKNVPNFVMLEDIPEALENEKKADSHRP